MNFNRILVLSFLILLISTYQTADGIIISLLLKLLLLKGALFMSMPLTIGAFMMGQGMGFFAGNMMGGYTMLRAANKYHNTEKTRWMGYGDISQHVSGYKSPVSNGWGWGHGSDKYQNAYDKGKDIGSAIAALKAHKLKLASAVAHIKGALHKGIGHGVKHHGWGNKYPSSSYGPPVTYYPTKSKGWGWKSSSPAGGYDGGSHYKGHDYYHASHSKPHPVTSKYKLFPYEEYKHFSAAKGVGSIYGNHVPPTGEVYKSDVGEILKGQVDYQNYYPPGSVATDSVQVLSDPSNTYYTSAYGGPGHEYTGILTHNDPAAYQDPAQDKSSEEPAFFSDHKIKSSGSEESVTLAPNPLLEKYLEKRLEEEAEKQKDVEQKQEAQQLIQMLRKAYLKQLVSSLKEEERLESTSTESSEFTRGSRSIERQADKNNIIRDLLYRHLSPMDTSTEMDMEASSTESINQIMSQTSPKPITSSERSSTEKVISSNEISSTERATTSTERLTSTKKPISSSENYVSSSENHATSTANYVTSSEYYVSSTESPVSSTAQPQQSSSAKPSPVTERPKEFPDFVEMPAMWVKAENTFSQEGAPFAIRVRRSAADENPSEAEEEAYEETQQGKEEETQSSSQPQEGATTPTETEKQISAFVDDIKKFFTLLTVLDQDQCLQKLVCDVHTNQKDLSTITQYEQNILTTFKLMKALMPPGEEDSSSKYRRAALIGETGQSLELCQQTYSPCGFSSSQIITLGTQAEATPTDWANVPQTAQTARRSDYVSVMPRVRRTLRSYY